MKKQISENLTVDITKIKKTSQPSIIEPFNAINKTNSRYIFLVIVIILIIAYSHKNKLINL